MSLRVLLADESSTIKKVMQLALQDFGVEVKSVALGIDVLQVAKSFKPDIVFADVLLSKKSGYEVCGDLKNDPMLKHIPVVLMWSGFMEIDEEKATLSKCDRRLEKPFDADTLRGIVKELISKSEENIISSYLTFPDMPPIIDELGTGASASKTENRPEKTKATPPVTPAIPPKIEENLSIIHDSLPIELSVEDEALSLEIVEIENTPKAPNSFSKSEEKKSSKLIQPEKEDDLLNLELDLPEFSMELEKPASFKSPTSKSADDKNLDFNANSDLDLNSIQEWEEPEEFSQVPLTGLGKSSKDPFKISSDTEEPWSQMPGATAKNTTKSSIFSSDSNYSNQSPEVDSNLNSNSDFKSSEKNLNLNLDVQDLKIPQLQIDPLRMEEILREEARAVLENIAWKILPDVIERVVRDEITRLTKEAEKL